MKIKNLTVILIINMIFLLSSCKNAPDNNMYESVTNRDVVNEYTESDTLSDEPVITSVNNIDIINTYNNQQIQKEITSSSGDKIIIDAYIELDSIEKIGMYKYIPLSISDDMRQSIFDNYFGDRASEVFCKDENRDIWQLGETRTGDFYKYEISFPSDGSGDVVFILSYRKPNLNYLDENLLDSADECGCLISPEEAKIQCDDFITSLLNDGEYIADSILAYGKDGQSPFYKIFYKRILDDMSVNSYNDIYMFIDDNGIEKISGAFYDIEEIETQQTIISFDEAINILKDNIEMIDFHNGDILRINNIGIEYVVEQQMTGEHYVVPAWRFEIGANEDENNLNRNYILAVNAFDGSIIQDDRG